MHFKCEINFILFSMPYTESCLREVMRLETLVPLNLPHRAQTNTTLNGYNIPKVP